MKSIKWMMTCLLLLTSSMVFADQVTVTVPEEIEAGQIFDMTVSLENTEAVAGYQMKLYLPEGYSLYYDIKEDDYVYDLSDRHGKKYVFSVEDATDGSKLIIVYSTKSGDVISGNSGKLFTIQVKADDTVSESKQAKFKEIAVSDADGNSSDLDDVTFDLNFKVPEVPATVTAKSYTRKYGEANPEFEFTSEDGELNGTPAIACEATATSPVGEYAIVITQGSVTNGSVTYVNGKLTIEKAPLTISGGTYTMKQGEELPAFVASYDGFKNEETEDVLTTKPTLSTTATSASEPGEYEVTVSGAEAQNYAICYVPGTLTIGAADAVTVTATSYTIKYGDAIPEFAFTSEGATLDGTPSITCEATSESPVGEYAIVITKGSVTNYNDHYVNGKLTIEKAPLTISGGMYTMKQGEELPAFTASYDGFVNDETEEVLTTKPTLSTTATSASEPGEYSVTVSGAAAQNYEISYVPGTLTITVSDGISNVNVDDNDNSRWYSLDGQQLQGKPMQKGVYIQNGHKVVIK